MSKRDQDGVWDFSTVIDLIHSLSSKVEKSTASDTSLLFSSEEVTTPEQDSEQDDENVELGNFDKVWKYLGQPPNVPPPIICSKPHNVLKELPIEDTELPDANVDSSTFKGVRWRDEVEGADLADDDEECDSDNLPKLSKARKKKLRQKKAAEAKKDRLKSASALATKSSENESEIDCRAVTPTRSRGSVIREMLYGSCSETKITDINTTPTEKTVQQDNETPKWPIPNPRYFLRSSVRISETPTPKPDTSLAETAKRKPKLIKKLYERFILEKPYLETIGIGSFTGSSSPVAETGVHIFVDASNVCSIPGGVS